MNETSFGSDILDDDEPVADSVRPVEEAQDIHNIQEISLRAKPDRTPDSSELAEVSFGAEKEPAAIAKPEPKPEPAREPKPKPKPKSEAKAETKAETEAPPEPLPGPEPVAVSAPKEEAEVPVEIPSVASAEGERPEAETPRRRRRRGRGERGDRGDRGDQDRGRSRRRRRGGRSEEEAPATPPPAAGESRTKTASSPPAVGQRIAILLDLHELSSQAREREGELAVSRLLRRVGRNRATIRAVAYITAAERRLASSLRDSGLEVVEVEAGAGAAVQIAVDAMAIAGRVDCVVLAPAQVALAPLATVLRSQGLRVETASFDEDAHADVVSQHHLILGEDSLFRP